MLHELPPRRLQFGNILINVISLIMRDESNAKLIKTTFR